VVVDWIGGAGDVRIDEDGRIVAFGDRFVNFVDAPASGSGDFLVARYGSDGTPDNQFPFDYPNP